MQIGADAICKRSISENYSLIIEGTHLMPGRFKVPICDTHDTYEFFIDISDIKEHKSRFATRQTNAVERKSKRYLTHFKEIRWVHDYLRKKASENNILMIDNNNEIEAGLEQILKEVFKTK